MGNMFAQFQIASGSSYRNEKISNAPRKVFSKASKLHNPINQINKVSNDKNKENFDILHNV